MRVSAYVYHCLWWHEVTHFFKALRYKPEGRGFDYRWSHWNFSVI